eukprot:scaffold180236_cov55-Attheya_sp.AAC.6
MMGRHADGMAQCWPLAIGHHRTRAARSIQRRKIDRKTQTITFQCSKTHNPITIVVRNPFQNAWE